MLMIKVLGTLLRDRTISQLATVWKYVSITNDHDDYLEKINRCEKHFCHVSNRSVGFLLFSLQRI